MSTISSVQELHADNVLPPVSLEQLNAQASLLSRQDTKYLVSRSFAASFPALLPPGSQVLEISGQQHFTYQSLYFDTPALDSYLGSAHRHRRRFKVRTRAYCDSGVAFLEVKTRGRRGQTVKVREEHDFARMDQLGASQRSFVASQLQRAGMDPAPSDLLAPFLSTGYRRTTYLVPGENGPSRVTVDTGLFWEGLSPAGAREDDGSVLRPNVAVIETKSRGSRSSADRLLWSAGVRPRPFSKYCTGVASLHPSLPDNKWSRTLRYLTITRN